MTQTIFPPEAANNNNNGTPTPAAQQPDKPAAPPQPEVAKQAENESELDRLKREFAEQAALQAALKVEIERMRQTADAAQLRAASAEAARPSEKLGNGMADAKLDNAVRSVGGPAHFYRLTLDQRLAAIAETPASAAEVEKARKLFGPGSPSDEKAILAKASPRTYQRLRAIARVSRVF